MKLLGLTERRVTINNNGENEPEQELTRVVLVNCDIINNQYQHDSRVLRAFVPNKLLDKQPNIPPTNHTYSETFHSFLRTLKYSLVIKTVCHYR